jgi:pilus assembly protein CpaC
VLQGIQASSAESAAVDPVSPYRAATAPAAAATANQPVDLGSAYRPAGAATGGSNQGASLSQPPTAPKPQVLAAPVPQPQVLPPVVTTAAEKTESVDLTSSYQPQPVAETAEPVVHDNIVQENIVQENIAEEVAEEEVAATPDPEVVADAEVATDPVEKRSLLEAMLAGEQSDNEQAGATSVDHAERVKHRFKLLGMVTEPTCAAGKCTEGTCDENVSLAIKPEAEAPAYPTTSQPDLVQLPTTVHDASVSQASHVVPAQWREAQPRAIQVVQGPADPFVDDPVAPGQLPAGHFEVIEEENEALEVRVRRSLLLRTPFDIYRTAVVDSSVCDVVQFTPREVSIIGKSSGSTNVTFWFEDGNHRPVTYVVRVIPDLEEKSQTEVQYRLLEDVLSELFPDSKIRLLLVADKLIVKGQAASAGEAANILAIIRGQSSSSVANNRNFVSPVQGFASPVFNEAESGRSNQPRIQVVNMLQVPGIQQVALRVKIAQLNRSAARGAGIDANARINFGGDDDALFIQSMLNMAAGNSPSVIAEFDDSDISLGLRYLQQQGVVRLLSEPTLVTLSGRPATFVSGGEFAVPTIVGSAGVNAVTTDFRAFGVIVSFLPTVLDKDRIRLQVAPEFSQVNEGLSSGGTFGLNVNAVTTTVEMREGQTFAIAGLLEDTMKNTKAGNIPFLENIFGTRDSSRNENELVILVTPELVHPMEPEEVPPLPGFDVTEPTNKEFYLHGHLEGHPTSGYRSTIWPELRRRYRAGGPTMTSGQFGHGQ